MTARRVAVAIAGVALTLGALGCSAAVQTSLPPTQVTDDRVDPIDRAVTITTTACGHASKTSGAGVLVDEHRVLASAHVVIGADQITVSLPSRATSVNATVLHVDSRTDLALLDVPGLSAEPIALAHADIGDELVVAGGGPTGAFSTSVTRLVDVRIEEVRSQTRSSRRGYELDHRVRLGDSGAGAFNEAGELVAIIYGRSQQRADASFAVRQEEILLALTSDDQPWSCDPDQHRMTSDG